MREVVSRNAETAGIYRPPETDLCAPAKEIVEALCTTSWPFRVRYQLACGHIVVTPLHEAPVHIPLFALCQTCLLGHPLRAE